MGNHRPIRPIRTTTNRSAPFWAEATAGFLLHVSVAFCALSAGSLQLAVDIGGSCCGVPVMFLFSDVHADYHKPSDDPEKIDNDKIRRVVRLVLGMIDGLQDDQLAL